MGVYAKIAAGLVTLLNTISSYFKDKQLMDAGEARANAKAAKQRAKSKKEADRIKHSSDNRTDDFEL